MCREAEERALRELEESKIEWFRLRELEDEYARSYQDASNRLKSLQGNTDPANKYVAGLVPCFCFAASHIYGFQFLPVHLVPFVVCTCLVALYAIFA